MTYDELMLTSKSIFNYHPDTPFDSLEGLLSDARKQCRWPHAYERGAAIVAEYAAQYIDEKHIKVAE